MKKSRLNIQNITLLFLLFSFVFTSCRKEEEFQPDEEVTPQVESPKAQTFDAVVPLQWNKLYLEVERYAPGYRPPVSARTLAYLGLSGYEAAVAGMPDYNSMEGILPGMEVPEVSKTVEYHWPIAVNAAYARAMRLYFPHVDAEYLQDVNQLEDDLNEQLSSDISQEIINRSIEYGVAVADAIFLWSETDVEGRKGFELNTPTYNPPTCVGCWQPTGPDYAPALLPYWGQARTFAMQPEDFFVEDPALFTTEAGTDLYEQAVDVYELYPLEYEDQWIAEFWGDDVFELTCTPAGRWTSIANQAAEKFEVNLEEAVYLYAKLGMAMNDGGVSCWDNKYLYNVARPSDFIKEYIDPNWETHLITLHDCLNPNFPAYPSGHATFGAAAAGVFKDSFGAEMTFTDSSHVNRNEFMGMPRTFNSWDEMAEENAYSRLPLGVHYQMDATAGLDLGYVAADRVNSLPWKN